MAKVQREWYSRGEFKNKTQTQCWGHVGMYHRFTHIADIEKWQLQRQGCDPAYKMLQNVTEIELFTYFLSIVYTL